MNAIFHRDFESRNGKQINSGGTAMPEPVERLSIRRLIVVPAIITLFVTLLRLVGELQRWSPKFFSREAGGAGALVGIVWLVPIFGIYLAIRLNQAGHGPISRARAIGFALAALVVGIELCRFQAVAAHRCHYRVG
jgi:hypothetical protein